MSTTPPISQLASDTSLLAGLEKNTASLPSLVLGGKTYTPADCASVMQTRVNSGNAAVTAKAAAAKAVQDSRNEVALTKTFVSQLRTAIQLAYSNAPDTLATYGLVPRKKTGPSTVEVKVVAVAKRKATRTARNTMGPRQKEKVIGAVEPTITITVPQPTPVASANGPSNSATSGAAPSGQTSAPAAAAPTAPPKGPPA